MAYKWNFIIIGTFLFLFSMLQQGVCFEDKSEALERAENSSTPLKDTSNTVSSKRGPEGLEQDVSKVVDMSPSKRLKQKIKVTLKGARDLDGFIENFDHSFNKISLTLENIGNSELLRLLAFLKDKQLILEGLKFEPPVSQGMDFSFIDEKGAIDFARFVTENKSFFSSFKIFEMSGHSIHYKGLAALCRAFSSLGSLRTFCVDDIGEDESEAVRNTPFEEGLKTLLRGCKNLRKLSLINALSFDSIYHIAEHFSKPPLTWLDLSANFFDGENAKILLRFLKGKKDLRLVLRENNILPDEITELTKENWGFEIDFEDQDIKNPELDFS
ncbi:MAG: hypothetical protein JSS34_06035 [Proteobacteria bacterium]|nr:hypothetical protein [Pseudomonadota bacterium]